MQVTQIRAAREALECELANLFAEFRGKTWLAVNQVSVKLLTEQRLCDQSPRVVGEVVSIELESI